MSVAASVGVIVTVPGSRSSGCGIGTGLWSVVSSVSVSVVVSSVRVLGWF